MKRSLLIFFATVLFGSAAAQSLVTATGKVLSAADSTALKGTIISVNNGQITTLAGMSGIFTITQLRWGKEVRLDLTFPGFEPLSATFTPTSTPYSLDTIFMKPIVGVIDTVVFMLQPPMAVQLGDTTQFSAAAFKTNPDANADDLIAKMPGVIIQEGKVEVQGEPLRRVYIDGKRVFDSSPMAALKSLPADAIANVQVFDEQSDQARYAGIEDGETTKAINIITKTKTKRSDIVRVEGSGGHDIARTPSDFRYLVGGDYTHKEEKSRLTVTGISNNVSRSNFNSEDISNIGGLDNDGNSLSQRQNQGIQHVSGIGANYAFDNNTVRFSGNYVFENGTTDFERSQMRTFYPVTDTTTGNVTRRINFSNYAANYTRNSHSADLRLEWNLSPKDVLILSPSVSYTHLRYDFSVDSTLNTTNSDSLNRTVTLSPQDNTRMGVKGTAMWSHRFEKKGRTFSISSDYSFDDQKNTQYIIDSLRENRSRNPNTGILSPWKPAATKNMRNSFKDNPVNTNSIRARISYVEPITPAHRISFNIIGSKAWSTNRTSFAAPDSLGNYTLPSQNTADIPKALSTETYGWGGGLGYSYIRNKFSLYTDFNLVRTYRTLDVTLPQVAVTHTQLNDFQPSLSLRYSLWKRKYLRLQYSGRTTLPYIGYMFNYINEWNQNSYQEGNPYLKPAYTHSLKLFYNASNPVSGTNFTLTLNASAVSNTVTTSTTFVSRQDSIRLAGLGFNPAIGATYVSYINLNGYYSIGTNATYAIPLKKIKSNLNLTLDYRYARQPSLYGMVNYGNGHSLNLRVGLTSNISEKVDFNFYSSSFGNYTANSALSDTYFINQTLSYTLNWIFWQGIVFNTQLTWRYYYTSTRDYGPDNQFLLNAGLGKKFFRRQNGELRLIVYDCLDQTRNLLHYVRNAYIDDQQINTLGRYVMLRFSYRFNSMSGKSHKSGSSKSSSSGSASSVWPPPGSGDRPVSTPRSGGGGGSGSGGGGAGGGSGGSRPAGSGGR